MRVIEKELKRLTFPQTTIHLQPICSFTVPAPSLEIYCNMGQVPTDFFCTPGTMTMAKQILNRP